MRLTTSTTKTTTRRCAVASVFVLVALLIGLTAGSAYAYFTSAASGTGQVTSGALRPVVVEMARVTPDSRLLPGRTAGLTLTLDNQNGFSLTITAIEQDGPVTVVGGHGCTSDDSGVSVPPESALNVPLAAGTSDVVIPAGAAMDVSSYTGCQGASFDIPVTVTVRQ